jgi:polysaccharide pyruvyl transferase WcaK-like protein
MTDSPGEVVLITKTRTSNKGNQALSAAWVRMLQAAFPDAAVRTIERRPRHLLQYSLKDIAAAPDPWAAFDALAGEIAALAPGPGLAGPPSPPKIALAEDEAGRPLPLAGLRKRLNLRGLLARSGKERTDYLTRLSAFQRAGLVIANPAGEIYPDGADVTFIHLLDIYVARKAGARAGIVNHTLEIRDPTLRRLMPELYRRLDIVEFRDEKSRDALREMGGDAETPIVAPDLALTTPPPTVRPARRPKVGVAIHTTEAANAGQLGDWRELIGKLQQAGFDLVFVSNELPIDTPVYRSLAADIPIEGRGLEFDPYTELLAGFDFLVTSRMHTGILAMVAGTPIVPVEPTAFKMTGLFQELGLETPVIRPSEPGWVDRALAQALALSDNREPAAAQVTTQVAAARRRIESVLIPALRRAAGMDV